MEDPSYLSGSEQKDRCVSEDSCSECSCEACHNADSAEESNPQNQDSNFTKMKDVPKDSLSVLHTSMTLPLLPARNVAVAMHDLQAQQARPPVKKQRRCSFCAIHGLAISIKGHKPFCHFREKCMCKGCTLIRCNQQVSRNQVRLRRQKDVESDSVSSISVSVDHRLETLHSLKKSPMCFKCWVHDSIRVRLKGHRSLCPYVSCSCSNCALNSDRKRLSRELRQLGQLAGGVKEKEAGDEVRATVSAIFDCQSLPPSRSRIVASQQHISESGLLSGEQCRDNSEGISPLKLHKDWMSPGIKQESAHFSNVFNGPQYQNSSFPVFSRSALSTEHGSLLPHSNWMPDLSFVPASSYSTVSRTLSTAPNSITTINSNCKCSSGVDFTSNAPIKAVQVNNLYGLFPQQPGFFSTESPPTVLQRNAGYMSHYPLPQLQNHGQADL